MIECPIYYVDPNSTTTLPSPPVEEQNCAGCNCGYLQFENLLPYLKELNDKLREDRESFNDLEFKLRQQIVEVSRLFDIEANVRQGYFSKAHYKTTQVVTTNGTKYLKVDPFVPGSLTVRTTDDYILDESSYKLENQHLVYLPCRNHSDCGCSVGCRTPKSVTPRPWPNACYKLTAKWGSECADYAVQMAVRDYLIELYRTQDPVKMLSAGIPVQISFRVPHSWETYITNFKRKTHFFSQFAIA